jgi:hypothetical protein
MLSARLIKKLEGIEKSMNERSGEPCAFNGASTVRRGAHACAHEV